LVSGNNFTAATTIAENQFRYLFSGCTGMTSAENLVMPATVMRAHCYMEMFRGCTSLTVAPELPATTLANGCYDSMFRYCSHLTTAPVLPAGTLPEGCYYNMFYNCYRLNEVVCLATRRDYSSTDYWLYNVAGSGTFTKKSGTAWPTGESGIPNGWTVIDA